MPGEGEGAAAVVTVTVEAVVVHLQHLIHRVLLLLLLQVLPAVPVVPPEGLRSLHPNLLVLSITTMMKRILFPFGFLLVLSLLSGLNIICQRRGITGMFIDLYYIFFWLFSAKF